MEYMSAPQAAEKWGISERRVQILCSQNRISGASKLAYPRRCKDGWCLAGTKERRKAD